jgi:signal transduction histidine kinase
MLDDAVWAHRHGLLCWLLAAHIPALFAFGLWQGFGAVYSAVEVAVPALCLVLARQVHHRRFASFLVSGGLVFCASVLVQLSGGMIEAHFHFFVLIGFIALYQDWAPFVWNAVFTVLSHGLASTVAPESMFDHHAGQAHPWTWALIHGSAVAAACGGLVVFWKNMENEQQRSSMLAGRLAASEAESLQRQSVSDLFVNLARRNQALLDRQIELITELEGRERQPEMLESLFKLDHLATRIRRNAESLLVLSGDEQLRRWGQPVALAEVVRAAMSEVEDYRRVDVLVTEHLEMAGRAVADMAHLLAELIENATMFSPPSSDVRIRTFLAPAGGARCILSIEDTGFGMSEADLADTNALLANPPDIDLRGRTLGFQVVARLARRYQVRVRLALTPGGGITALVALPDTLVAERTQAPGRGRTGEALPIPPGPLSDGATTASLVSGSAITTPMPALATSTSGSVSAVPAISPAAAASPAPAPAPASTASAASAASARSPEPTAAVPAIGAVPASSSATASMVSASARRKSADRMLDELVELSLPAGRAGNGSGADGGPGPGNGNGNGTSGGAPNGQAGLDGPPGLDVAGGGNGAGVGAGPGAAGVTAADAVTAAPTARRRLVRRVPGAELPTTSGRSQGPSGPGNRNGEGNGSGPRTDPVERDRVRHMLTNFQAGQQAGKAAGRASVSLGTPASAGAGSNGRGRSRGSQEGQ